MHRTIANELRRRRIWELKAICRIDTIVARLLRRDDALEPWSQPQPVVSP